MKQELLDYGLSSKEVEIYLAALKSRDCTANRLSGLTNIRRSTVYEVIESLKKKGLISSYKKDKKSYFSVPKPEALVQRLNEKKENIKRILPELKSLIGALPEKPSVQLFEGLSGIKNAIEEMLNYKEILVYGASKMGDIVFKEYAENFARKRASKKVMMKAVIEPGFSEHMIDKEIKRYTKIKTLEFFQDHNSVYFIYEDNLIILTLGQELIAIKIKSPLLVKSQKEIFNHLWKTAKSLKN